MQVIVILTNLEEAKKPFEIFLLKFRMILAAILNFIKVNFFQGIFHPKTTHFIL